MANDPFVARLRKLDVCDVSDAVDALELPPAVTGLFQTSAGKPIAGRAVTVKFAKGPAPAHITRHVCTGAVEAGGPDDLIVCEQRTGVEGAGWGGILSRAAAKRGIVGTIVEGPVRDIEESEGVGYTVYGRTCTSRTARGRIHEGDFQCPIAFGDLTLHPGDYVTIDRSGCVVIPAARIADVLARAEQIAAKSAEMCAAVDAGVTVSKVMGGDYEHMLTKKAG